MKATWSGDCPRCPYPINPGDDIVPHGGTYIHRGCASGQDDE